MKLLLSLLLPFAANAVGSIFTSRSIENWYSTLNKPSFAPPDWIFAPVWILLYLLMGLSFYLIWKSNKKKRAAVVLFFSQLALNAIWSPIFFGAQQIFGAFLIIILLDIFLILTILEFQKIDRRAAWLLYPYLGWILFATLLNYQFFILN